MHGFLLALAALLPTAGVAFLFYIVIKAMVEGDRRERQAHAKWDAEHAASPPMPDEANSGDVGRNTGP